ncbi:MAG: PIN domain-containing protein [Rhizobiales bacterium]|jgi:predicted nucleic acid-binding protein|nr:PIN domain-containing protein [Hyphomicrobiales bacterium]
MAPTRLYLDTNVFIAMFERNDELARLLLHLFSLNNDISKPFLTTSELSLAELLVLPYREGDDRLQHVYDNATISNEMIEVGPVNRDVLWQAAVLKASYTKLKLPDAIHLSTAMLFRCSHFLTADKRLFGTYSTAQRRGGVYGPAVAIETMALDVANLQSLIAGFTA